MLTFLCFVKPEILFAQDKNVISKQHCKNTVLEFYGYAKTKDYLSAYEPWVKSFKNCPSSSKMIYIYGLKIIEDRYQNASGVQKETKNNLIDTIFAQRIRYFPDNLGKVYSDWASSLEKRGASKTQIFEKLELSFNADPAQMGTKNIAKYFQEVTDKHKDSTPQRVFDTYDDVLEAVNKKIDRHSKAYDVLKVRLNDSIDLSAKERIQLKNHEINLKGLGQIEGVLDAIFNEAMSISCKRILPLYKKGLDAHKTDIKWLRRTVLRLNRNECTDNDFYKKILEAYMEVDTSPRGCILFLDKNKEMSIESIRNIRAAIKAERDPYKRAEYYYRIAQRYNRKNKILSRQYAHKALKERPSLGKAYILIATLYASSANACGTDELSKRMVFIAAADKAKKAKEVDPSITSRANRYIKSYMASAPSKSATRFVSGKEYEIKCWIGETVKIP